MCDVWLWQFDSNNNNNNNKGVSLVWFEIESNTHEETTLWQLNKIIMEPEREGVTTPVSTFNHRKRLLLKFLSATFNSFSLCSTNQEKKHPSNHTAIAQIHCALFKVFLSRSKTNAKTNISFMQPWTHRLTNSIQLQNLDYTILFKEKLPYCSNFQHVVSIVIKLPTVSLACAWFFLRRANFGASC